jgi:YVTN family beta-propeller protein
MQKIKIYSAVSLFMLCTADAATSAALLNVGTIPVGITPAAVGITPDSRLAYVANNNNYGISGGDTVSVLNIRNNTLIQTISDPSFNQPYTVTINAAGTKAYITNSNAETITIIDIPSNTVSGVITGFDGPSGMVITPDGTKAYVNNYGGPGGVGSGNGTTLNVVDLATNSIIGAAIDVDQAPAALAISPDGKFVYSINYVNGNPGTGTMSVVATSSNSVVATITGFSGPFGIALTPDGRFAYVTNFGSNNFAPFGTTVSVVDLKSNAITATIGVGIQPSGIAITPDGKYAYVTNYNTLYAGPGFTNLTAGEGTVTIIDIATNTVIPPTLAVGESPSGIAITPNGKNAYVTNYTGNTVSVLTILERMWLK